MILALKTDNPVTELYLLQNSKELDKEVWESGNQLSVQLLGKIKELLERNHKTFQDLAGVIGFEGPGSFTGLRIGLTVANTLAYGLSIPVAAGSGKDWLTNGQKNLAKAKASEYIMPSYGAEPHITAPKK